MSQPLFFVFWKRFFFLPKTGEFLPKSEKAISETNLAGTFASSIIKFSSSKKNILNNKKI
jgi:hypothetical protein